MSIPVFNPPQPPGVGLQKKREIKIQKADFGDGYTQSALEGINPIRKVLDLEWPVLSADDCKAIMDFLDAQAGVTPFAYQLPGESSPTHYTCETYAEYHNGAGLCKVTATFRQSFALVS